MASAYPKPNRVETFPAVVTHVEPLVLPLEIDDAILTAPVLYGELFPLVSNPPAASASREEVEAFLFGPNPAFTNALVPRPRYTPAPEGVTGIDFETDDDAELRAAVLEALARNLEPAQNSEPKGTL